MKFFKKIFLLAGVSVAGYFGLKFYRIISSITKLHKSLPEFLNNVYGEKPALHITHNLKSATIKVGFSQAVLEKHTDIETTVREYIDDFYPELMKNTITIELFVKSEMTEESVEIDEEEKN